MEGYEKERKECFEGKRRYIPNTDCIVQVPLPRSFNFTTCSDLNPHEELKDFIPLQILRSKMIISREIRGKSKTLMKTLIQNLCVLESISLNVPFRYGRSGKWAFFSGKKNTSVYKKIVDCK